jgi:hypothetical protein
MPAQTPDTAFESRINLPDAFIADGLNHKDIVHAFPEKSVDPLTML